MVGDASFDFIRKSGPLHQVPQSSSSFVLITLLRRSARYISPLLWINATLYVTYSVGEGGLKLTTAPSNPQLNVHDIGPEDISIYWDFKNCLYIRC